MTANSRPDDPLQPYRDKRDAAATPEPFGGGTTDPSTAAVDEGGRASAGGDPNQQGDDEVGVGGVFVVQLHEARKRHYDFRIELGGVLLSWAVPKGPSRVAGKKRMAVKVEDHPLEYATFEGVIPDGNYGAGAVIVWDRGVWQPVFDAASDPAGALERGVLHMRLSGFKLRGQWMLVRTGKNGAKSKQWLLFKKADEHAEGDAELDDTSVLSGLTVAELLATETGDDERRATMREELARLGAPARALDVRTPLPMLCHVAEEPFSDPDWVFELKYDGYRLLAEKRAGRSYLRYRSGRDATRLFPNVARAVAALPYDDFILDGEVAVLDETGASVFNRLQQRNNLTREADIRRATVLHPVTYMAFDLLWCEGHDLREMPLLVRKHMLRKVLPGLGALRFGDHVLERGEDLYELVRGRGLEGIVAKKNDAPYVGKRSELWLKIRVERVDDFAIVGYTTPRGTRAGFGSLHLAVWERDTWVYAGRVGTGFDHEFLLTLSDVLEKETPWDPTFEPPSSPQREDHWREPRFVCVVKYQDWPAGAHLRFPRFLYLRDDKRPEECLRPRRHEDPDAEQTAENAQTDGASPTSGAIGSMPLAGQERAEPPTERNLRLSNLDKVYFPAQGDAPQYRKGRLLDYYRTVAPFILPYLRERPLALTRYPNGIEGESFFQKDMPTWVPDWIRTETLWSKHVQRELRYVICDSADTLVFLANMGAIPLHVWNSRLTTLSRPDWCVIDLDPKGAPMAHVVQIARALRDLCHSIGLACGIKTSGQDGLHVMIPLGASYTFQQSHGLAELLAKVVAAELPDIATTARRLEHRRGRVYIDYVQNSHGRLIAAPLSVRPRHGAPVSMPLRWREVNDKLDPRRYTMANAVRRMERMSDDPLRLILEGTCDLPAALTKLAVRVGRLAE